jgi:hypothetical protein
MVRFDHPSSPRDMRRRLSHAGADVVELETSTAFGVFRERLLFLACRCVSVFGGRRHRLGTTSEISNLEAGIRG